MRGYTLVELLVVVGLLGIISAISVPLYVGYSDTANVTVTQNNLRSIYMQEKEYFLDNSIYYSTGGACADSKAAINANLFNGVNVIDDDLFAYCILQVTTGDFTARAEEIDGDRVFTLNENNVNNF